MAFRGNARNGGAIMKKYTVVFEQYALNKMISWSVEIFAPTAEVAILHSIKNSDLWTDAVKLSISAKEIKV